MSLPRVMLAMTANVILTADGQEFYNANITLPLVDMTSEQLEALEVDTLETILKQAPSDFSLDRLCKVSLCYHIPSSLAEDERSALDKVLKFLTRNSAKYYFQPNQRGSVEMRIIERVGVASNTEAF